MSISQEGSGFPYFSQSVYQYLCGTNPLEINACLLSELNAFEVSTSRTASVSSHSNKFLTAWTAASIPEICLAQSCNEPAASWTSSLVGRTPGFLLS